MKRLMIALALVLGVSFSFALARSSQAAGVFTGACSNASASSSAFCADQNKTGNPLTGTNGTLYKVSKIIASVAAITAVIMMIVGGFMYVLAGGDPGKANTARDTILYAAIGLVIIGVAQGIISLIVNSVSTK
ncbi:MAG: hypothetical protein ACQR33_03880 [Candidatus Saccharibacteria bacterium]